MRCHLSLYQREEPWSGTRRRRSPLWGCGWYIIWLLVFPPNQYLKMNNDYVEILTIIKYQKTYLHVSELLSWRHIPALTPWRYTSSRVRKRLKIPQTHSILYKILRRYQKTYLHDKKSEWLSGSDSWIQHNLIK